MKSLRFFFSSSPFWRVLISNPRLAEKRKSKEGPEQTESRQFCGSALKRDLREPHSLCLLYYVQSQKGELLYLIAEDMCKFLLWLPHKECKQRIRAFVNTPVSFLKPF